MPWFVACIHTLKHGMKPCRSSRVNDVTHSSNPMDDLAKELASMVTNAVISPASSHMHSLASLEILTPGGRFWHITRMMLATGNTERL